MGEGRALCACSKSFVSLSFSHFSMLCHMLLPPNHFLLGLIVLFPFFFHVLPPFCLVQQGADGHVGGSVLSFCFLMVGLFLNGVQFNKLCILEHSISNQVLVRIFLSHAHCIGSAHLAC